MEQIQIQVQGLDPETLFLATKQETGNEWELSKENVKPLKRGRNVRLLNDALKSQTDDRLRKDLLEKRRSLIEEIDKYEGDDPLQPWIECIKWVQESFPPGGDSSGLVVIYEQCVRTFWHSDRYKNDLRYLKVWLEYAENCRDAEVIYSFLEANDIGQTHSLYYISYALHMECKNKIKAANDIFNRGISRNAQPMEKLNGAFRKFIAHTMRRPQVTEEDSLENPLPARSFGTVLAKGENGRHGVECSDLSRKKQERVPLSIFNDNADFGAHMDHNSDTSKKKLNSWQTLGSRAERNKENNAIPSKWTSYKIPQRPLSRSRTGGGTPGPCIEVFVDEECTETHKVGGGGGGKGEKSSILQLRRGDGRDLNKETEMLRENPLRNFPSTSLPR